MQAGRLKSGIICGISYYVQMAYVLNKTPPHVGRSQEFTSGHARNSQSLFPTPVAKTMKCPPLRRFSRRLCPGREFLKVDSQDEIAEHEDHEHHQHDADKAHNQPSLHHVDQADASRDRIAAWGVPTMVFANDLSSFGA